VPRIASAFVTRGHSVAVLTLADQVNEVALPYAFPVRRIVRSQAKWRRVPQTVRAIAALARKSDVILSTGLGIECMLAAWLTRTPHVLKIVGDLAWERGTSGGHVSDGIDEFQVRRYSWRIELHKRLRTHVARCADVVVTPSQYLRQIVTGWGVDPRRLHVVYNALESEPNCEIPAELPSFEGYTVVTVGRLVPWKGIDRLLRVLADLANARLIVVGDGPEGTYLRHLARQLHLDGRVFFAGEVSSNKVRGYLRASDIFVLNSTYEGLPHVVLEALQAGVPVIATDVGGTREVIEPGMNGLLVSPGDVIQSEVVRDEP
jgi:glycosyltransferase involved in cell wall biosynthesis